MYVFLCKYNIVQISCRIFAEVLVRRPVLLIIYTINVKENITILVRIFDRYSTIPQRNH